MRPASQVVLDELHSLLHRSHDLQVVKVPGDTMCFPCAGFFLVPFAGKAPVPAVPFAPDVLFLYRPKDNEAIDIREWTQTPGTLTAFSCALAASAAAWSTAYSCLRRIMRPWVRRPGDVDDLPSCDPWGSEAWTLAPIWKRGA